LTIPNDPHQFVSCGEDWTIRCFDLRVNQFCNHDHCNENLILKCKCPVTSMSLHPLKPFEIYAGCADNHIRVFDRRMIAGWSVGRLVSWLVSWLVGSFRPTSLSDGGRHRITSLQHNQHGDQLLASYSSEYVYLFDLKVLSSSSSLHQTSPRRNQRGGFSGMPIKKLRLRSDWSDTGPKSRPESQREASTSREAPNGQLGRWWSVGSLVVSWVVGGQLGRWWSVGSGSDCGHIFVWDKMNTRVVMTMEADSRVVNCLQPHPTMPVLASSGIDYDVKLWMPMLEEAAFDEDTCDELTYRNMMMLEETKGTVSIPANFVFRLLTSLRRGYDNDGNDNDDDGDVVVMMMMMTTMVMMIMMMMSAVMVMMNNDNNLNYRYHIWRIRLMP
ncbi:hypothetical protein HELRODRAFT_77223, partial [Helobdella robusta]|uniref:Uncharacterized protein n=1 Tax=Helobdella robusta TaxID=6412 RepID=T1G2U7_HELRO